MATIGMLKGSFIYIEGMKGVSFLVKNNISRVRVRLGTEYTPPPADALHFESNLKLRNG